MIETKIGADSINNQELDFNELVLLATRYLDIFKKIKYLQQTLPVGEERRNLVLPLESERHELHQRITKDFFKDDVAASTKFLEEYYYECVDDDASIKIEEELLQKIGIQFRVIHAKGHTPFFYGGGQGFFETHPNLEEIFIINLIWSPDDFGRLILNNGKSEDVSRVAIALNELFLSQNFRYIKPALYLANMHAPNQTLDAIFSESNIDEAIEELAFWIMSLSDSHPDLYECLVDNTSWKNRYWAMNTPVLYMCKRKLEDMKNSK